VVGTVIASCLDLTPQSAAQTVAAPPFNSVLQESADQRDDIPRRGEGRDTRDREHPHPVVGICFLDALKAPPRCCIVRPP
jgi:hypothetical protein